MDSNIQRANTNCEQMDTMVSHMLYETLYDKAYTTPHGTPITHYNSESNIHASTIATRYDEPVPISSSISVANTSFD